MKKIILLSVLSSIVFSSCASTKRKRASCDAYHSGNPHIHRKTKPPVR